MKSKTVFPPSNGGGIHSAAATKYHVEPEHDPVSVGRAEFGIVPPFASPVGVSPLAWADARRLLGA